MAYGSRSATEGALKAFQTAAKLAVDGKAGPLTLAKLGVLLGGDRTSE